MLSHDIRSLREKFAVCAHGGITLPSDQVERIVACLKDCERQASALETSSNNGRCVLTEDHLKDWNVTLFPVAKRRGQTNVVAFPDNGETSA